MVVKLGGNYDGQTGEVTFAVFSQHASHMELYCYRVPQDAEEILIRTLLKGENDRWSITFSREELIEKGISDDYLYYGYRAWGPNWEYQKDWKKGSDKGFICDVDTQGNRFNPNKLLIDPYGREVSHDPEGAKVDIDPNIYIDDYYGGSYHNNRIKDTGRIGPKSILLLSQEEFDYGVKPQRLLKDDIIYEINLRGLSMLDDSIPEAEKGTFKGATRQVAYLQELGITAIELLPVHEFADTQNDDGDSRGDNYWGYMTLNYFSPNRRYSSDKSPGGPTREFKEMVKVFHEAGIKVFLDVVYNHTGEGLLRRMVSQGKPASQEEREENIRAASPSRSDDQLQDTQAACILSFAGLDNQSYYLLRDKNVRYEGRGSCGGNLNYDHLVVKNLIIDSLQYWTLEMGVDGFRFDLAPILSITKADRGCQPTSQTTMFEDISKALPSRGIDFARGVDLIAEPWGDGSDIQWQDKFPWDWAVWNKDFRDVLKTSFNKYGINPLPISEIAKVISGSEEFIKKRPWNSINYIVSHDDCNSLRNLFSYNQFFHLTEAQFRQDQISWDQGGDLELQKKAVRNAFVLLLLSPGVPMFAGGDELFRKIPFYDAGIGKMNMVSVDSPEVYIDFAKYHELRAYKDGEKSKAVQEFIKNCDELSMFQFVKKLIEFRKKHECLRPTEYFGGKINPQNGFGDLTWHREDGAEIAGANWDESDFIAYRFNAEFEKIQHGKEGVNSIYIAYNRSPWERRIIFPPNLPNQGWYRVLDTDGWMSEQGNFDDGKMLLDRTYTLHERSILVLVEKEKESSIVESIT